MQQDNPGLSKGSRGFFMVRPVGRTYLEVQVFYSSGKGSVSGAARASRATANLEDAEGKVLA